MQRNVFRACGLYTSVAQSGSLFADQARSLLNILLEETPGAVLACTAEGWTEVPRTFFTLGADHSVTVDASGITVSYRGSEHDNSMQLDFPGFRMLPVRYTPLDIRQPVVARRHFIQIFSWVSDRLTAQVFGRGGRVGPIPTRTLNWGLHEIVGADALAIAGERALVTVTANSPPKSFNPERILKIRVNAKGEAEWVILTGANLRTTVIPVKAAR